MQQVGTSEAAAGRVHAAGVVRRGPRIWEAPSYIPARKVPPEGDHEGDAVLPGARAGAPAGYDACAKWVAG